MEGEVRVSSNNVQSVFTPAAAYYNQRHALAGAREEIVKLSNVVGDTLSLTTVQWAQLVASVLEFKPDLIIELGRNNGNSTCAFTQAANLLRREGHECRVVSICLTDTWQESTLARVRPVVPEGWFAPLQALTADILTLDYDAILADARRCLLFWDAHGFEVAECVLGNILPKLEKREHIVVMHDLSDARYHGSEGYNGHPLWKSQRWDGPRLRLGHIDSAVEQAVAIVDFSSRNDIPLHSADHSLHTELGPDADKVREMEALLGSDLFSLAAHWFWFTLNGDRERPIAYPRFHPVKPARRAGLRHRLKRAARVLVRGD